MGRVFIKRLLHRKPADMSNSPQEKTSVPLGFPAPFLVALLPVSFIASFAHLRDSAAFSIDFHSLVYAMIGLFALLIGIASQRAHAKTKNSPGASSKKEMFSYGAYARVFDTVAALLALLGIALVCFGETLDDVSVLVAAVLLGTGIAWLSLRWGALMACLETDQLIKAVLAGLLISSLFIPVLSMAFEAGVPWEFLLCLALVVGITYTLPRADRAVETQNADSEVLYGKGYLLGLGGTAVGVLIVTFTYSITVFLRGRLDYGYGGLAGMVTDIMVVLCVIAVYVWLFKLNKNAEFYALCRIIAVVFAACALVVPLTEGALAAFLDGTMGAVVRIFFILLLPMCAYVSRHSKFHPFLVFGILYAAYGLPQLLEPAIVKAMADIDYLGSGPLGLYNALILFFTAAALATPFVRMPVGIAPLFGDLFLPKLSKLDPSTEDGIVASADRNSKRTGYEQNFSLLAEQHGLTEREVQVMRMVCFGRSKRYIAETLYVSENTVKAYSKSLYAKLGVHTKQELIDAVESAG